jgi:hypothetical protein
VLTGPSTAWRIRTARAHRQGSAEDLIFHVAKWEPRAASRREAKAPARMEDLQQYLVLREEYWRQRAAGESRKKDDETRRRLEAADRSADVVMRRLLAIR